MQRILLTGGSGLLGTSIIRLQPEDTHITATYNGAFEAQPSGAEWRPFDLTSPESVAMRCLTETIHPIAKMIRSAR